MHEGETIEELEKMVAKQLADLGIKTPVPQLVEGILALGFGDEELARKIVAQVKGEKK
jgi:hypothetical protein